MLKLATILFLTLSVAREAPFNNVIDDYGKLVVQVGKFKAESDHKPWSSWWYPLWQDTLFDGDNSPLGKYDELMKIYTRKDPQSSYYERKHIYDGRAVGWAGLCSAWAVASIMEKEPTVGISLKNIYFGVSDLKALLLKSYEVTDDLKYYGQRYNGEWDSVYADLYPEQFHKFMQAELFEKKRPFIMDHDAGIEVWNVPSFKAQTLITKEGENSVRVKTWMTSASPHVEDHNFIGTKEVIRTYTYILYGEFDGSGNFHVANGEWTESSRWEHPDYLIPRPDKVTHKSYNPQILTQNVKFILNKGRR